MYLKSIVIAVSLISAGASQAATLQPNSAPVALSPAFGPLVAAAGTAYNAFGVDFSFGNAEGIFDDGDALAFGGANSAGNIDLLSVVDGRIVEENTSNQGVTNFFFAEAGYAAVGTLTLELFDLANNLLGTVLNDLPVGSNGRTTFSFTGAGIASFRISGTDTFGVNQISLNTPTSVSAVPLPAGGLLIGTGIAGLALLRRRRKS